MILCKEGMEHLLKVYSVPNECAGINYFVILSPFLLPLCWNSITMKEQCLCDNYKLLFIQEKSCLTNSTLRAAYTPSRLQLYEQLERQMVSLMLKELVSDANAGSSTKLIDACIVFQSCKKIRKMVYSQVNASWEHLTWKVNSLQMTLITERKTE